MKKHLQPLTPAALYARVSSDRQDVDRAVAAQLRALRNAAVPHGYVIARKYVGAAESGRVAARSEGRGMIEPDGQRTPHFQVSDAARHSWSRPSRGAS